MKNHQKNILNCCKLQAVFKNKSRLGNAFHFKDLIPKDLTSGTVYFIFIAYRLLSFSADFAMSPVMRTKDCVRHMDTRIGKHTGISAVTKMQVKNSSVGHHLLCYNFLASFGDFSILNRENKKFLLEVRGSLFLMRNKPSLNRNITLSPL